MAKWLIVLLFFVFLPARARAQNREFLEASPNFVEASLGREATESAEKEATRSATPIVEKVVEKKPDITEPKPEIKGKLEKYLSENPAKPLTITNFLQHAVREAVKRGVPANTIVLILLFPLVAAIIAATRHLVGIRGFGIFIPAVLSVAFVATGVFVGILLFVTILVVATSGRFILRILKLQYLPRMALLLWFVSLGVFAALFASPFLNLEALTAISIFPILLLTLLTEQFIGIQIGKSMREAIEMTFETLVIALLCSLIFNLEFLQKFVLLHPEITLAGVALFDIYMGKYIGLRLLEYKKFREILK